MKKRAILILSMMLATALVADSALAARYRHGGHFRGHYRGHYRSHGYHYSGHHHYWNGWALGLGAAIVGGAVIDGLFYRPYYRDRTVYVVPSEPVVVQSAPPVADGYWQDQRTWVPPITDNVWQDGYYDPNGTWVEGHWSHLIKVPGYWHTERVWISTR